MRLVVIGPGALGTIFAEALGRAGHGVALLGRASPRFEMIRRHGLRLQTLEGTIRPLSVVLTNDPAVVRDADALIVLVKAADTAPAMARIAPFLPPECVVLTLQNGLHNARTIREALGPGQRVLPGVTSQAGTKVGPGLVVHAGAGPTRIGYESAQDATIAENIASVLASAGLPATAVPDIGYWIWRKAALNAAINGLTALGGFPNGEIAVAADLLDAAETIAEEVAAVARSHGIELGAMRGALQETARATAKNRSSMLQDLEAGRGTEVEAIHGAIQAAARSQKIATPGIDVLAALIRAKTTTMKPEEPIGAEIDPEES